MNRRRKTISTEQSANPAGSPPSGEPVYLAVGRLRRPHGLQGEILLEVLTDFPERIRAGKTFYLGDQHVPVQVTGRRTKPPYLLIRLAGVDTPEQAGEYRNQLLFTSTEALPTLPEGEYYHHQILGLRVVNEAGEPLGVLEEILETGANDVYQVKAENGQELLLPAIDDVILEVNLERGEIRVRPPEWS